LKILQLALRKSSKLTKMATLLTAILCLLLRFLLYLLYAFCYLTVKKRIKQAFPETESVQLKTLAYHIWQM